MPLLLLLLLAWQQSRREVDTLFQLSVPPFWFSTQSADIRTELLRRIEWIVAAIDCYINLLSKVWLSENGF